MDEPTTNEFAQLYRPQKPPLKDEPKRRRKCTKICHATPAAAWKHAESLKDAGYRRSAVYRCWRCGKWHVTRRETKP